MSGYLPANLDMGRMTDEVAALAMRPATRLWRFSVAIPAMLVLILAAATGWLFYRGVGIWGIDWPVAWGFAIINYVWWIGIASGGTFISALFFLTQAEWRGSVSRMAESMTVFAAACAGIFPILHLGRPWLFYWLFPMPNTMTLWPQFRSPLLWDFFAILTYVSSSALFWYFGAVPDFATMRDRAEAPARRRIYGVLAMGFRGEGNQWRHYRATYGVLAAIMAPLVVSVHSIVGLDFAAAATPGWHSTEFPPFFVFGALLSGIATVLLLLVPMRRLLGLRALITERHLDILGKLMLMSSLLVGYAYLMDAFTVYYQGEAAEKALFATRLRGEYAPIYWETLLFNLILPQLLWWRRVRVHGLAIALISLGVIIGMWAERYSIVVMSLRRTHLPSSWGNYHGTLWDWALLSGSIGLFLLGMLLVARYVPIVSMSEMRELWRRANPHQGNRSRTP
jgi:Ni/Fe-hydrogenase subunit HybB-like protein